jgi:hypothetical protein
MSVESWLTRLTGGVEEINGHHECPTYMYRWTLLKLPGGVGVYLHKFVGDDWSLDMHDHPKRFISVGLRGSYVEHYQHTRRLGLDGRVETYERSRVYSAPWVRSFPAEHTHRLALIPDDNGKRAPCWTLVVVLRASRPWGFWPGGKWVFWRDYIGSDQAHAARACDD